MLTGGLQPGGACARLTKPTPGPGGCQAEKAGASPHASPSPVSAAHEGLFNSSESCNSSQALTQSASSDDESPCSC